MPLCHCHPRNLLPCLPFCGYFIPYSLPAWTVIKLVLLRASLPHPWRSFLSDHPMSYNRFCTHPPSITRLLLCPQLFGFSPQHGLRWPQPHSFLQLLTFKLGFPAGASSSHFLRTHRSHVHLHLVMKPQSVPLRPRSSVSHITAPAGPLICLHSVTSLTCYFQAFSCSSLHLFGHTPSVSQKRVDTVEISSSTSQLFTSRKSDKDVELFFPATAAICLLSTSVLSTLSRVPSPSLTTFSLSLSRNSS